MMFSRWAGDREGSALPGIRDREVKDQGQAQMPPGSVPPTPTAPTPPVTRLTNDHFPGTEPDNVPLIALFPKVSPFLVKIQKMRQDEDWLCHSAVGSSLGAWGAEPPPKPPQTVLAPG